MSPRYFDNDDTVARLVAALSADGVLVPVSSGDDDARRWMDCELCSFVENRCHEFVDPTALTMVERERWRGRALADGERIVDPRADDLRAAFWILEGGVRLGTIAVDTYLHGRRSLPVSSLYVHPAHRGAGTAFRALGRARDAAAAMELDGIRLATHWTWQAALRRYLFRYRMWAWSFKRSIDFVWSSRVPPHVVAVEERAARFGIEYDGRTVDLIAATRDADRLIWTELSGMTEGPYGSEATFFARSTFAVALAIHGWPLLRDGDDLDAVAGYDIGGPDLLARKIAIFEWLDRQRGFDVRTPRIPGLPYDVIARELEAGGA